MLVTITNISGAPLYVSTVYKSLAINESVTFQRTGNSVGDDLSLKTLVQTGQISLEFIREPSDDVYARGWSIPVPAYDPDDRPDPSSIPKWAAVFDKSTNQLVFSDGNQWLEPTNSGGTAPSSNSVQKIEFSFNSAFPIIPQSVGFGQFISRASLLITSPFNGVSPTIQFGTLSNPSLVLDTPDIDLGIVGQYSTDALVFFTSQDNIILNVNPGTSTSGSGILIYEIDKVVSSAIPQIQKVDFTWNSSSPLILQTVSSGQELSRASVIIDTPFDDPASQVLLGTAADPDLIFDINNVSLQSVGQYETDEITFFAYPDNLILTINSSSSTSGSGTLFYEIDS